MTYFSNEPVYRAIAERFLNFRPQIKIGEHIKQMKKIGRTVSEGIEFVAKDPFTLQLEIAFTRTSENSSLRAFHWDNRKIWIHRLAALATDGEGYREIGTPSLHCAIGKEICSVHIDEFGFVERGIYGGTYYTPDSVRHIVDELVWRAKIRPHLIKGLNLSLPDFLSVPAGKLLDRTYIVTPSAENNYNFRQVDLRGGGTTIRGSDFRPRIGVGVKLIENKNLNFKFEYTCGSRDCSDQQALVKLTVDWKIFLRK